MSRVNDILSFWFGDFSAATGKSRKVWFVKDFSFDREIEARFLEDYRQAAVGTLDHWQTTAQGCLGLSLVLDQFPRNMFRGQAQAFATDTKALAIAHHAIDLGFDQSLPQIQRWFIYIPFMHSEDLNMQRRSVELFSQLADDPETQSSYSYAIKHLEVIERFGRFPHRNAILSRESTAEEVEFLKQPGSSF